MENFAALVIPVLLIGLFVRMIALPLRCSLKILLNSLCGFLCLWLLNLISGFTGLRFPINTVTVAVAGFLGLPGIGVLALVQLLI